MCPGSGECGLGRVGEVLVRIRLFRLLVLQLEHKNNKDQIDIYLHHIGRSINIRQRMTGAHISE